MTDRKPAIDIIGAFETTYMPAHDRDVAETTGHDVQWRADLQRLLDLGVTRLRYPVRWHRIEEFEGSYDWSETDEILGFMQEHGMRPIVDLVHHTSYPRWLEDGFADPRFPTAYLRFAEALAVRYPSIGEYTLFNEPFSTLFLAGHEALWPPYRSGIEGFLGLIDNVLPAVAEASRMYRELLPGARHVYVDTCEHHNAAGPEAEEFAAMANDRRFFVIDRFLGRPVADDDRFVTDEVRAAAPGLFAMEPGHIDVLGLDYYAHCQWQFLAPEQGVVPTLNPIPLSQQIREYWDRYGLPCMLTETNLRGYASDRATWLKYTLEQCELAQSAGVPMDGYCWFPVIDSADWNSLLNRCEGSIDPVGVWWLDEHLERRPSTMSAAYAMVARGARAEELPAFRYAEPVATWLQGYLAHTRHWEWQDRTEDEVCSNTTPPDAVMELRVVEA